MKQFKLKQLTKAEGKDWVERETNRIFKEVMEFGFRIDDKKREKKMNNEFINKETINIINDTPTINEVRTYEFKKAALDLLSSMNWNESNIAKLNNWRKKLISIMNERNRRSIL